ncbi:PepSY domain-containing protein [Gloeocapsopsis crepidinum LEGE 06123]|uniref:PepSY domain-containing protein n=1 Tax=Gloeocapsopsis crepidinum LEGE 06123 TaxID=588587 RepID=A0ABR9UQY6_9CHRO|nr:PepSY domain-containing protein [Gloeocapsopsis crepidinum]MBE9190468.1 PepSY domain-containing protein [Gloeocapsopsis crepidinum LEGE 06123]
MKNLLAIILLTALSLSELAFTAQVAHSQSNIQVAQAARWRSLAKISLAQARKTAESAVGGTASSVNLADRNGGLVYEVIVGDTRVIVDAGNGFVLYSENITLDSENNEGDEDSFRPRSSVQIPDSY